MKNLKNDLFSAVGEADDKLIENNLPGSCQKTVKAKTLRLRALFVAAAVALAAAAVIVPTVVMMNQAPEPTEQTPIATETAKTETETQTETPVATAPTETPVATETAKTETETQTETPVVTPTPIETATTPTPTETPDNNQPLYFSSDNVRSMLLKDSAILPGDEDAWHNAIMGFGAVTLTEKSSAKKTINSITYYKVYCEPVWCYGTCSVPTPEGTVPDYVFSGRAVNTVTVEEALRLYPYVYLPESIIDEVKNGDTLFLPFTNIIDANFFCLYCADVQAEQIMSIKKSAAHYTDEQKEKAIARIIAQYENERMYIPVVDGKLIFDADHILYFSANRFNAITRLLDTAQRYKAQYLLTGELPDVFFPVQYIDAVPDFAIKSGISIEEFGEIMTWYELSKKEYLAFFTAYNARCFCENNFAVDYAYIEHDSVYGLSQTLAKITAKTNETIVINGLTFYKVLCDTLADTAGMRYSDDRATCKLLTSYDSKFAAAGCLYIDETSIDGYDVGDSVLFNPYRSNTVVDGKNVYLLLNSQHYLFKNGKMQKADSYATFDDRNLMLLYVAESIKNGFDFSECCFADLIDTFPTEIFEEGMNEQGAAKALNWIMEVERLYRIEAREQYLAAGGWIFID